MQGETSDPSDNLPGSIWHNSTTNRIKSYVESAIRTLVSENQTQTLTNKTIGDDLTIQGTTSSTNKDTGALVVEGGVGIEENLNVGGNAIITGDLTVNGTTVTINTATLDVEDQNITVNINGNDVSAEGAGLTINRAGTDGSLVYEDALASKFKAGALGSEIELANISSSQTLTNKSINADSNTITNIDDADIKALAGIDATKIADGSVTSTEFQYINSLTSNAQTQLNGKADTQLGNLTGTTTIDVSLLPRNDITVDIGSGLKRFTTGNFRILTAENLIINDANNPLSESGASIRTNGNPDSSRYITMHTVANNNADGNNSGNVRVMSGNRTSGITNASSGEVRVQSGTGNIHTGDVVVKSGDASTGDSGDIVIQTGTAGGTRGIITLDASDVQIPGKLTVTGGIDPAYLQLDPQAGPGSILNNSLFVDSNDSNKLKFKDNAGDSLEIATGSIQSGINYIQNPDAEVNVLNTNVSASASISQVAGIRGDFSFGVTFAGTPTLLDYAEWGMENIDPADNGKTLFVSFDYSTDSGIATGDFKMVLRESVGGVDIPIDNGNGGILDATGDIANVTKFTGRVQLDPTKVGYSLRVVPAIAGKTGAMKFDRVTVGPDTLVPGAIITEWENFTPSFNNDGGWTISSNSYKRRVGDNMEVRLSISFSGAGASASAFSLVIPDGLNFKGTPTPIGTYMIFDFNNNNIHLSSHAQSQGTNTITFTNPGTTGSLTANNFVAGGYIRAFFSIPINEWSAGAMLSTTETLFSTTKASVAGQVTNGFTSGSFDYNTLDFPTIIEDKLNIYNVSNGKITIPKDGLYLIEGCVNVTFGTVPSTSVVFSIGAFVNGSDQRILGQNWGNGVQGTISISGSSILKLNKGDLVELYFRKSGTSTLTAAGDDRLNYFALTELPDFSTFSVYGQSEYLEVSLASTVASGAADTWVAVTGMTLELTPGEWELGYSAATYMNWISGSSNGGGNVAIQDPSSSIIEESISSLFKGIMTSNNDDQLIQVSNKVNVIVTTTGTYQLYIRSIQANTVSRIDLFPASWTGSLTNPDGNTKMWARRIK